MKDLCQLLKKLEKSTEMLRALGIFDKPNGKTKLLCLTYISRFIR